MNTAIERRRFTRRIDDHGPDGGAVVMTLCILSIVFGVGGFVLGSWFGWCLK